MASGFKLLRSVEKNEAEQGKIFYTCQNYAAEPRVIRAKIERLCAEAGGEHRCALFDYLTTDKGWVQVTQDYFISSATLDRVRRRFYELW